MNLYQKFLLRTALLLTALPTNAQGVFKCTQGKQTIYQSTPCTSGSEKQISTAHGASTTPAPQLNIPKETIESSPSSAITQRVNITAESDYGATYSAGLKIFNERCRDAGKIVRKSFKNVAGIRLEVIPVNRPFEQRQVDRDWASAGMPLERVGEEFIASFLDFKFSDANMGENFRSPTGFNLTTGTPVQMKGFEYVDVAQKGGRYIRYRLANKDQQREMITKTIAASDASRFKLIVEPLGSAEDRVNWVAGSHIKVIDTQNMQVIGELRSFSFALPPTAKGADLQKRIWTKRLSCPKYSDIQDAMTRTTLIGIVDPNY